MKVYLYDLNNEEQLMCQIDFKIISCINRRDIVNIKGRNYFVKNKVLYFQNSDPKGDNIDLDYVEFIVEELK